MDDPGILSISQGSPIGARPPQSIPEKKERSKIFALSLNFPETKMLVEKRDSSPRSGGNNHMAYHLEPIIIISSPLNKKGHP